MLRGRPVPLGHTGARTPGTGLRGDERTPSVSKRLARTVRALPAVASCSREARGAEQTGYPSIVLPGEARGLPHPGGRFAPAAPRRPGRAMATRLP